jgi:hypothetical protein
LNPSVRGFVVESIALAAIGQSGLDGIAVSEVKYFDDDDDLLSMFSDGPRRNVLYVPKSSIYPKLDAVLVSHCFEPKVAVTNSVSILPHIDKSPNNNSQDDIPQDGHTSDEISPDAARVTVGLPPAPSDGKQKSGPRKLISIRVQFIQITIAKQILEEKLANSRSLLLPDAPEQLVWSQLGTKQVKVEFKLRWLVARNQVSQIRNSHGFSESAEKVSALSSVHAPLRV